LTTSEPRRAPANWPALGTREETLDWQLTTACSQAGNFNANNFDADNFNANNFDADNFNSAFSGAANLNGAFSRAFSGTFSGAFQRRSPSRPIRSR